MVTNSAVACVTEGRPLSIPKAEREGVTAHELTHIKNKDMLISTMAATMAGAITNLLQMAISRQREFKADRVGAEIAGTPDGLASALLRLESASHQIPMQVSPASAQLAIVNPLAMFGGLTKLFATHPPTEDRVRALQALRAA